jgi:hypothetical protein
MYIVRAALTAIGLLGLPISGTQAGGPPASTTATPYTVLDDRAASYARISIAKSAPCGSCS